MRIGTKSLFWTVFQAGWSSVYSPLEGLDQHHLSLGCEDYTPRPALSLTLWATNLHGEIALFYVQDWFWYRIYVQNPTPKYNFNKYSGVVAGAS